MLQVITFSYDLKKGWSVPELPHLDSDQTLLLVFASEKFKDAPYSDVIKELLTHYPRSHIIGCSSAGEIFQNYVSDDSVSVALVKFEHTHIKTVQVAINSKEDSYAAGQELIEQLQAPDLNHIFLLSDGLNVNGTELVNGILQHKSKDVNVTGGLAGDGSRFKQTWTLSKSQGMQQNTIVAAGLYGKQLKVSYGSKGGWDTFGPERVITRSYKNVLYEIDGQPALPLYKKYLGDQAKDLPASALLFPMAIRESNKDTHKIVRTILAVDENEQSLTFAGDMPEHWLAQLMTATFENLVEGAANAAAEAAVQDPKGDILSIAISCIGRRLILGPKTEDELEAVLETLPTQTKQIGFYSYGEISPSGVLNCDLHNQTMTLTTFMES